MEERRLYAYTTKTHNEDRINQGKTPWVKVGDTTRPDVMKRIREQLGAGTPDIPKLIGAWNLPAGMRDYQIHKILENHGIRRVHGHKKNEWFEGDIEQIKSIINKSIPVENTTLEVDESEEKQWARIRAYALPYTEARSSAAFAELMVKFESRRATALANELTAAPCVPVQATTPREQSWQEKLINYLQKIAILVWVIVVFAVLGFMWGIISFLTIAFLCGLKTWLWYHNTSTKKRIMCLTLHA